MTYDNTDSDDDGIVDANVNNESVNTGSLTDSQDDQAWETLREVGYEKGDDVFDLIGFSDEIQTTSSDSFTDFRPNDTGILAVWDRQFPSSVQGRAFATGRIDGSAGDITIRLFNKTDNDLIVEKTISSFTEFTLGPVNYTPPTTGSLVRIALQFRSDDNTSTVEVNRAQTTLGYQI
jgi:hypothetical protein